MNDRAQTDRAHDAKELGGAWQIVINGAESGAYAGAVALVTRGGAVRFRRAAGWALLEPSRQPMTEETIFDLASLTKVVATLPSVLLLVAAGELALDDPVGRILPEFGIDGWRSTVTIRRLLSHSAGLPAWLPLYLDAAGPEAYLAAITQASPVAPPGDRVVYSDLGFILLGEIVRRLSGRDIARFAATEVFAPLGMGDTMFNPPATVRHRIAATEDGNQTEIGMCGDRAGEFPNWRRRTIWGEANDGNAFYGLSGIAGHAGLFGTATDLARYGRFWLHSGAWEDRQLLPKALMDEATRAQAPGRGLGWRLPVTAGEDAASDPGGVLGPRAYGHTGFTGTSLWIDPAREGVIVLLTNRLHPTARPEIETIRPAFHAAVVAAWHEEDPHGER